MQPHRLLSNHAMQPETPSDQSEPRYSKLESGVAGQRSPIVPSQNAFALQQKQKSSWDQTIGARVRESQRVRERANTAYASSSTYSIISSSAQHTNETTQTPRTNESANSWNYRAPELPLPASLKSTPQSNSAQSPPKPSSWTNRSPGPNEYNLVPTGHSILKHNPRPDQADSHQIFRVPVTRNRHGQTDQDRQPQLLYPRDPADLVNVPDSHSASQTEAQAHALPGTGEQNRLSMLKPSIPTAKNSTPHHKRIRPRDDNSWKKDKQSLTAERLHDIGSSPASTTQGPLDSPTEHIQHLAQGRAQHKSNLTSEAHDADWGRLPFRKGPQDPHPTDTPHLTRSKTRKFVPTPINAQTAQTHAAIEIRHNLRTKTQSPSTEVKPLASPQKRVMQKVFSFVKGKPVPVHPVSSQSQDFISGPLPPGITPSKAAQVLGTASTNSRHVLPSVMPSPVPQTPSINGLDLAGTDIHPALRPQFQARPSAGTLKRSNTFDSSTSLVARGAALTPLSEYSQLSSGSGLAGLGLQYYEENSPPTPPLKDSSYLLPRLKQSSPPRVANASLNARVQIEAAKPYPQPSRGSGHTAQSMHAAYETASSSSLFCSDASPKRLSKSASGFSVATTPQLLPEGHLPAWSYKSTPLSSGQGVSSPKVGSPEASTGSPTPRKRASLLPSPLRQAADQNMRRNEYKVPSLARTMVGQQSIHPSFQSSSTAECSVDGTDARLQSLEARFASLEERMTARLAELSGAQSVLVRGVGEWAANCDALTRSTAQVRQGVMGVSLEVEEVLQEVSGLAGSLRDVRESLDLIGRRMRGVERGYGEVKTESKAVTETIALMQQQLVGIAHGVDSIAIFIVRNEERMQG